MDSDVGRDGLVLGIAMKRLETRPSAVRALKSLYFKGGEVQTDHPTFKTCVEEVRNALEVGEAVADVVLSDWKLD